MLTDNEIIKALEYCEDSADTDKHCLKCPYCNESYCLDKMMADALSIINRQKAEIERLENGLAISRKETKRYIAFKGGRGFGKQFFFSELVKQAKAEAIKEFAGRSKDAFDRYGVAYECYAIVDNVAKGMGVDTSE